MNLEKGKEALRISLEKRGITTPPSADLAFVLDVSGSFDVTHRSGVTQRLLERLVPWGMLFDPDQKLDVFTFSHGRDNAVRIGDITPGTCERYIQTAVINSPHYGGGTDYGFVIEKVLQHFGWIASGGFLGRMFGGGQKEKKRSIVLFVTDGENSDPQECSRILEESEKRGDEVYFLFIGIGGPFQFLQQIGDRFSNTGLVVINDLKGFVEKSDEELNEILIGDELVTWLKK